MAPPSLQMLYSYVAFFCLYLPAEGVKLHLLFPNRGEKVVARSLLSEWPFFDEFIIFKIEQLNHHTNKHPHI